MSRGVQGLNCYTMQHNATLFTNELEPRGQQTHGLGDCTVFFSCCP